MKGDWYHQKCDCGREYVIRDDGQESWRCACCWSWEHPFNRKKKAPSPEGSRDEVLAKTARSV